jgi:hypothetical protein
VKAKRVADVADGEEAGVSAECLNKNFHERCTSCLIPVFPVVVSKFPFHHRFAMDAEAEPSAHSEVVGVGLRNAEVIEKYASLDTILCEQPRRTSAQQES